MKNQIFTAEELQQIRLLEDFDLINFLSEIHDHGALIAKELLPLIANAEKARRRRGEVLPQ